MSMEPIQRRMSKPNAGTVQVQELMTDDITLLTFIQLSIQNTILDIYNDPDPAATVRYTDELFKNSISIPSILFADGKSSWS